MTIREKLEAKLQSLTLQGDLEIRSTSDMLEASNNKIAREIDSELLTNQTKLAKQVKNALRKLEYGGWGICEECEGLINGGRLEVVPWAPLCLGCQEHQDRLEKEEKMDYKVERLGRRR